ncbi:histamine H2 receptor-like [Xenia sp. Carnegie-2017]|uniref:histamine H2 receptor-like n=1 Tax=Xenia sp. Carnegie-2017 TaxID=2897299 RepID=UPI001F04666B|nr:histamine H2 receptor-like [Xenia sp. Carnegie-2017]
MGNNTTISWTETGILLDYHSYLIACAILICIANCLVFVLFFTNASLRTNGNYLLFSLAISDLFVGLIGIPLNIGCEITQRWNMCLSGYSVNRFIAISTVYHIFWITLEKYAAILFPFKHKLHFDRMKVKLICLSTWLGSIFLSVIELTWLTKHNNPNEDYSYDIKKKVMIYNIFIFALVFVFPISVMVFAYASIFLRIVKKTSNGFLRKHGKQHGKSFVHPRHTRTAILFFGILLMFILSWFWWFYIEIYYTLHASYELVPEKFYVFLISLRYSTSFLNPVSYTFFKRDFSKALKKCVNRLRLASTNEMQRSNQASMTAVSIAFKVQPTSSLNNVFTITREGNEDVTPGNKIERSKKTAE